MLDWLRFILDDLDDDEDEEDTDDEYVEDSDGADHDNSTAKTVARPGARRAGNVTRHAAHPAAQSAANTDNGVADLSSGHKWNGCLPDSSMLLCGVLLCQLAVTAIPIATLPYVEAMGNYFLGAVLASMGGVSIVAGRRLKGARLSSPKTWLLIAIAVFPIIYALFHQVFVITILYILEVIVTGGVAGGLLCLAILLLANAGLSESVFTWGIIVAVFGIGMANGFVTDWLLRKRKQAE